MILETREGQAPGGLHLGLSAAALRRLASPPPGSLLLALRTNSPCCACGRDLATSGQFTFSPSPATGPERFQFCVGEPPGAPAGAVHIKKSPSSGPSGPPTPFVPPGHFPLIGGIVLPPWRGKAFGRVLDPPLRRIWKRPHCSRRDRSQTGPPGFAPGALAWQSQAQRLNRTSRNFCIPRTQWPGGNSDTHSDFARQKFSA